MVDEITEIEKGICNIRTVFEDTNVKVTHVISRNDDINSDKTYIITINNDGTALIQVVTGYDTSNCSIEEEYTVEMNYNIVTVEIPIGQYNILSTPSSLEYSVNSITVTITNEEYVKDNKIVRTENDITIVLSKCGEVLLTKSCKYFHHDPFMTPNNYDLYFNYAEIPLNIIKESPSDLQRRLQKTLPLTKILHLNLETENTPHSNNLNLHSHVKMKYYNTEGKVNGGYLTVTGSWNVNELNAFLEDSVNELYGTWIGTYIYGRYPIIDDNPLMSILADAIDETISNDYYLEKKDTVVVRIVEDIYELVKNKSENWGDVEKEDFENRIRENLQTILYLFLYNVELTPEQHEGNTQMIGYDEWFIKASRHFIDSIIDISIDDFVSDVDVYLYQNGICLNPKIENSTDSNVIKVEDSYEIVITLTGEEYNLLFNDLDVWFIIDGVSQGFKTMGNHYLEDFYLSYSDFREVDGSYVSSFSIIAEKVGDYEITPVIKHINAVEEAELDSFEIYVVEEFPIIWEKPIVLTEENNWQVTLDELLPFYEETDGVVDYDKIISYTVESDNSLCRVRLLPLDKSYLNPVEWDLV